MTNEERASVVEMETSLEFTDEVPPMKLAYPLLPRADLQRPNFQQAMAVQRAHEARIQKLGIAKEYKEEMEKYKASGTITRITPQALEDYKGGKHFISHFPVVKMSSTTTKVRIVSDSAMKNNVTGLSFNDLVKPVPNALAEILTVCLGWRSH